MDIRQKAKKNLARAGGNKSKGAPLPEMTKNAEDSIDVRKAISEEAGVSGDTVWKYGQIKEQGSPELLAQVQNGNLKIGTAHRMLKTGPNKAMLKKIRELDNIYDLLEEFLPFEDASANHDILPCLNDLSVQLGGLLEKLERRAVQ